MKIRHLIPSLETTLYYHPRMIKYEDAIAKSLHYVVDPIMAINLQLVYIQYGEISRATSQHALLSMISSSFHHFLARNTFVFDLSEAPKHILTGIRIKTIWCFKKQ
jgi:hypothetical protein